MTESRHIAH